LKSQKLVWGDISIYLAIAIATLGIFYIENIKNGFIYAFILMTIFLCALLKSGFKKLPIKNSLLVLGLVATVFGSVLVHVNSNDSWRFFLADFRVASHVQPEKVWSGSDVVFPRNEYGKPVSPTNFERVFYLTTAYSFVKQYPLGYGLVQSSFGHIAREQFFHAPLIQSHSGWMDLTLGIGIPGVTLLLVSAIVAMLNARYASSPWNTFGVWSLLSVVLLFLTTEVGQKNYVDTFIWLTVMVGGLGFKVVPQVECDI